MWTTPRDDEALGEDVAVRWDELFDDLEGQLDAQAAAELAGEVADRTRRELALVELTDRVVSHVGRPLVLHLVDGSSHEGVVTDVAQQWLVLQDPATADLVERDRAGQGPVLVPVGSVVSLVGLGSAAATTGRDSVRRRISLSSALRAVARDRSPVRLGLADGSVPTGTLDAVGADHVDLAEHPADEPRRAGAVRRVRTVPFTSLVWLRPAPGRPSSLSADLR